MRRSTRVRRFVSPQAGGRSRPGPLLLIGLALSVITSGCGGASPEARTSQTKTALEGTRTPTPLELARTAIARGTFTGIDRESRVILTAEAFLPIVTPVPSKVSRLRAGQATDQPGRSADNAVATHLATARD